jgi:brefeldin A-inhibited guanine nucleotide-exchange protein
MAQPEDTMDTARDPQVGRDEQQEQQKPQPSEVGMAQEPNGSLEVPSLAAEREPEPDASEELERTQDLEVNGQPDNDTVQGPMSAAHSMQEIPLDSPGEEGPPVVPVKSPTLPATPRLGSTPRNSLSVHGSSRHHRSLTLSRGQTVSSVLITSALDIILESREAKKSAALKDATQRALDMINAENDELIDSRVLFEPLRLACETRSEKLMVASLDCISKLISYSFFTDSAPPQHDTLTLPDLIVHTITSAYTETTSDAVSLQIVKSLLALVLSNSVVVHHSSLLKAVRTIYNVFLLSQNSSNQLVAQGGLTQMIHHVFSRCKATSSSFQSEENLSSTVSDRPSTPSTVPMAPASTITTPSAGSVEEAKKHLPEVADTSMETPTEETASHRADLEQLGVTVQKPVNLPSTPPPDDLDNEKVLRNLSLEDMFIKDAYLVFRALCKLSMKPLITER